MGNIIINGRGNYDEVAKNELGATHSRIYFTKHIVGYGFTANAIIRNIPFATHYFNSDDNEVGYVIENMVYLCGLVTFDSPRIVSDSWKLNADVGHPCDISSHVITNKGYVGENKFQIVW